MDKGVRGDYLDRQFKALEDDVSHQKAVMTRQQKQRFYDAKTAYYLRRNTTVLEEFQMVQEARPLKPPGRR